MSRVETATRTACVAILVLGIGVGVSSAAQRVDLSPAAAGDMTAEAVTTSSIAARSLVVTEVSRESVRFDQAMRTAVASSSRFIGESVSYRFTTNADELARGVVVHATAPGAIVQIHPIGGGTPIDPSRLALTTELGRTYTDGSGMQLALPPERMAQAPFAPGTAAFRLQPDLGSGALTVRAGDGHGEYVITVLETDSPWRLTMAPRREAYLHGQRLTVDAALLGATGESLPVKLDAVIVSPAGRTTPLRFRRVPGGGFAAEQILDANERPAAGLWEIRARGEANVDGVSVKRDLRVAFDVAVPFARLTGAASVDDGDPLSVTFDLEVAAAGRYEVRSVLYGTLNGELAPLGIAYAADWLEDGPAALELRFGPDTVGAATAPFELRDLMLLDQGRMGVLHRQSLALRLN